MDGLVEKIPDSRIHTETHGFLFRAFLNLGGFVVSAGGQYFLNVKTGASGTQGALNSATFNLFQLVLFLLAFVWSSVYAVKIYSEIRQYGKSLRRKPQRRNSSHVEAGTGLG